MSFVRSVATLVPRLLARLSDVGLSRTAASLAFTTLLGLVPLATVTFAFVARFPAFSEWLDVLEVFLLKQLLPAATANLVRTYVLTLAERASQITGVSIAFVVVTAMLMIGTVEREINLIWGIPKGRALHRKVVIYLFGLTLGPVLVGASMSLTSFVVSRSLSVVPLSEARVALVGHWLPLVFTAVAFTLLYAIVPARRVPWPAAIVGGVAAAFAFEGAKQAFAWYVTHMGGYEVVYGAFAALPVFMLWVYLSWVIVLVGAAVVATLTIGGRR